LLTKEFLAASNRPKKSLGQHFLTNPAYINKIADAAGITAETPVIEIGPGAAGLTEELLRRTKLLTAIEFDRDAADFITDHFPNVKIINADVLKTDLSAIYNRKAVIVGNLPYNISVRIFEHCTNHIDAFTRLVFMFQSEVADRLTAVPKCRDYSSLSVYATYHYQIKQICRIGGGNFFPKTKVSSSVLEFTPLEKRLLPPGRESGFFLFLKECFKQKRKTLRNNIPFARETLDKLSFHKNVRAEELSLPDFIRIYDELPPS
jgi:16S rRNA (adenine1518-N6/adenine1519-N6)-dimethyltransferase